MSDKYLGYSQRDLALSPYTAYFKPRLGPLQEQVTEALLIGGQAEELFPTVAEAPLMQASGYQPMETGFTRASDASMRVFCLTHMPRVEPRMWDWWFGWHGCDALRYKLWHPRAHIAARWADGGTREAYVGRTSLITEYLGSSLREAAISFVAPGVLGFDEESLSARGEVVVCARVGIPGTALKGGWLLHQIRAVDGGSEMRSRMWFGGENAAIGDKPGPVSRAVMRLLRHATRLLLPDPSDLLVHNAQEMAHLAGFLPELYAEFGPATEPVPS